MNQSKEGFMRFKTIQKMVAIFSVIFLLLAACTGRKGVTMKTSRYPIVPKPQLLEARDSAFTINARTGLRYDAQNEQVRWVVDFIRDRFGVPTGYAFPETQADTNVIVLKLDAQMQGADGVYQLEVSPQKIVASAPTARGLFYAMETVRQLLPKYIESRDTVSGIRWKVPALFVKDWPRFKYRGMHLDVGRHFFPVKFIKKYIDLIALHKMNYFHWHLTEDQGWRIEIKHYPKLTQISAWRKQTLVGHGHDKPYIFDGEPYGGYYTQDQVREIVDYARKRFVTIVPEIEMPGHSLAALAAYPELGCTGGPYHVAERWGIFKDVYCAGNDKTFEFLENVLSEIVDLFPGKYIHIGGDEVLKDRWKTCPKCQARIKKEGLKSVEELQSYFIQRIEKFLLTKNRYIIGWDEILEGGLAPQATVMSWRGEAGGIEAAKQHHDVIMTPGPYCYFDHYQADPRTQPLAIGGFLPMKKVYSYDPVPKELAPDEKKYILGVQGNVWSEYLLNEKYVEYMAFPRACALSEVAWTDPKNKDWKDFLNRLQGVYRHLEALNVNYFRGNIGDLIK